MKPLTNRLNPTGQWEQNHIGLENTLYKILLETESIKYTQTKKDNLTRNQRIALANFSKRTDIVIIIKLIKAQL